MTTTLVATAGLTLDGPAARAESSAARPSGEPAEAPPSEKQPEPDWHLDLGFSFLATSGNSETSSAGLDASFARSWNGWALESAGSALRASEDGEARAERLGGEARGKRRLASAIELTLGARGERDRFAGIDLRSTFDLGLLWSFANAKRWKGSLLGAFSYSHEDRSGEAAANGFAGALAKASGGYRFSDNAEITAQVTFHPSFEDSADYRLHGKTALQAALNQRLALRIGYELRYDNRPVAGFETTDSATTASLVVRLGRGKAEATAPDSALAP